MYIDMYIVGVPLCTLCRVLCKPDMPRRGRRQGQTAGRQGCNWHTTYCTVRVIGILCQSVPLSVARECCICQSP
jgi:hypothetical protein